MAAPNTPPNGPEDAASLGDRTLDRLMGIHELDATQVQEPPLSGNPKKDWDARRHRESTVGDRVTRRWRLRRTFPGDGASFFDILPDIIGWAVSAAVVIALLYLVWYGLVFFQIV